MIVINLLKFKAWNNWYLHVTNESLPENQENDSHLDEDHANSVKDGFSYRKIKVKLLFEFH